MKTFLFSIETQITFGQFQTVIEAEDERHCAIVGWASRYYSWRICNNVYISHIDVTSFIGVRLKRRTWRALL
jgi:hypothetical protein